MLWLSDMLALALTVASLALAVWAVIDAATRRSDAFPAIDRQSKKFWLIVLGLSAAVLLWFGVMSFLGLPAVVAAIVYIVDVRPKLTAITRGPQW